MLRITEAFGDLCIAMCGILYSCLYRLNSLAIGISSKAYLRRYVGMLAIFLLAVVDHPPLARARNSGIDAAKSLGIVQELLRGELYAEAADVLQKLREYTEEPIVVLHLADVYYKLGRLELAIGLLDDLLCGDDKVGDKVEDNELKSFVLNRRGILLAEAGDLTAARQSYERALALAHRKNHHASYNFAMLLHYRVYPTTGEVDRLSVLLHSIELYYAALGHHRHSGDSPFLTKLRPSSSLTMSNQNRHRPMPESAEAVNLAKLSLMRQNNTSTQMQEPRPMPTIGNSFTQSPKRSTEAAKHPQEGVGGPVNRIAVSQDLAIALLEVGQAREAVMVLEYIVMEKRWIEDERLEDASVLLADATVPYEWGYIWGQLAGARVDSGDFSGAVAAGKKAIELVEDDAVLYHNMGVMFQKAGLLEEAEAAWLNAVTLEPNLSPSLASLGHLAGAAGNIEGARQFYELSLGALTTQEEEFSSDKTRTGGRAARNGRGNVLTYSFLVATAGVPIFYESNDHISKVRRDFEEGLGKLLLDFENSSTTVENPLATVGSGSLGYYLIYQGLDDKHIRRKLALAYWKFAPSLRYSAPFLLRDGEDDTYMPTPSNGQNTTINQGLILPAQDSTTSVTLSGSGKGNGSTLGTTMACDAGHAGGDSTLGSKDVVSSTVAVADGLAKRIGRTRPTLTVEKENKKMNTPTGEGQQPPQRRPEEGSTALCRRRLRVGFLSAFFFHHSVGLLTHGVITRLDRSRFETTAIFLQPHPTTAYGERNLSEGSPEGWAIDDVYTAVRQGTENVVDLPASSLTVCRHTIASLELDVLVFTEIGRTIFRGDLPGPTAPVTIYEDMQCGMDIASYFLSFARLARRSALFWGHAVTSGITAFDGISTHGFRHMSAGSPFHGNSWENTGGVDYFVSSWLFEDQDAGRLAQRKYGERLYLMRGLTTRFNRPPAPAGGLVTRKRLGIPPRQPLSTQPRACCSGDTGAAMDICNVADISDGIEQNLRWCGAVYLVPQTLYKLHPDFDRIVARVLRADSSGCAVFIQASDRWVTQGISNRLSQALLDAGIVGPARAFFVPRLSFDEFSGLCAMADVVLDPFPVGGGRSSLEVFAVGTPIVMLYNRTSILQLTYGMYAIMGLEGPLANTAGDTTNTSVSLVTYSERDFVSSAVAIATNVPLNARVRKLILSKNHRLYEQDSVVTEWEHFLEGIASSPRPPSVEHREFAVDASDFPTLFAREFNWCHRTDHSDGIFTYNMDLENHNLDAWKNKSDVSRNDEISMSTHHRSFDKEATPSKVHDQHYGAKITSAGIANTTAETTPQERETSPGVESIQADATSKPYDWGDLDKHEEGHRKVTNIKSTSQSSEQEQKLLYAVQLFVERGHDGAGGGHLQLQVYAGVNPLADVKRLMEARELDHLQYRWIGTALCRAIGRLGRPLVWMRHVQIDAGPSFPLEVRLGDDLFQVAKWHLQRNELSQRADDSLGAFLAQEIPQHAHPAWISSRSQDFINCETSSEALSHSYRRTITSDHVQMHDNLTPRNIVNDLASSDLDNLRSMDVESTVDVDELAMTDGVAHNAEKDVGHLREAENRCKDNRSSVGPGGSSCGNIERIRQSDSDGDVVFGRLQQRQIRSGPSSDGGSSDNREDNNISFDGCITLAITTCKRIEHFMGTVAGLQHAIGNLPASATRGHWTRVCEVIVVDDGSSKEDRLRMMETFPRFTYVFKGSDDRSKGHAASMNLIITFTKTRYLLYVEDDWWAIQASTPGSPASAGRLRDNFLSRAMHVLRWATESVGQVLINDQSSRACAYGNLTSCRPGKEGANAGWPRFTPRIPASSHRNHQASNIDNQDRNSSNARGRNEKTRSNIHCLGNHSRDPCESLCIDDHAYGGERATCASPTDDHDDREGRGDDRGEVEYRLHEFGVMYPSHTFSFWPGFSLNPALWDLRRLEDSYRRQHDRPLHFDPGNVRFEQTVSIELLDAGVAVAYLPDVTFQHVGGGSSAYVANGMHRPWDRPVSTATRSNDEGLQD